MVIARVSYWGCDGDKQADYDLIFPVAALFGIFNLYLEKIY